MVLIQRAQVLRFQIAPERVDARARAARAEPRAIARSSCVDIRARVARRAARAGVAVRRAAADARRPDAGAARGRRSSASSASTPSGRCSRCSTSSAPSSTRSTIPYLRERKGDVADVVGRLRMNLRQGVATPRDLLRELDESSVLIADELTPSLAAQLDWTQGPRLRHRRRQPHVSHRDPRALARSAGGRRPARRQRASSRPGSWSSSTAPASELDRRSRRRGRWRAPRVTPTIDRPARGGRRRAAAAGGDRRRRAGSASTRTSSSSTISPRRATPAPKASACTARSSCSPAARRHRRRGRQYEIYRGMLEGMAPGTGHGPHVRPRRGSAGVAAARADARRRLGAGRGARQPAGPARPPPQPDAAGAVPGRSCARCCARRATARCASCSRSCRASSRCARRGAMIAEAAADLARRGEHGAARCRSA